MTWLAKFAATPVGKLIVGAAEAGAGAFVFTLMAGVGDLGLSQPLTLIIGSMLGAIAGRLGIPSPPAEA